MKTVIKMMHADAGHGWLAVKTKELVELGIADKISSCSFYKGKTTYLEEDCDAGLYINAQTAAGVQVITKSGKNWETCPVRFFKRVEQVVVPQVFIDEAFEGQKFEDVDQETLDKELV